MIAIRNNILALYASDQLKTNARKKTKSMERLSSGYRINRSADDAAGLAISEKMRRQIRGLMQGTANAEDGISYVQVSDGAMGETHDILQRMNELTIQSLNDTLSESDREYLNSEFKQLRTEIDRINTTTDFNDQRVFEDHENSYWSITGNKRWDPSQAHTVLPAPSNEMYIHLPANYNPNTYTLSVPVGTYTTLELADEIDTVIENLTPSNPGFVFEYTEEGYCKLTFEGGSMINSVDGPMSYLFFDSAQGSSSSDLLGTTEFGDSGKLEITSENDQLSFLVERSVNGGQVSIKIPSGKYSRSEMIQKINVLLREEAKTNPAAVGITAGPYGESNIKITGGANVNITGLKGDMLKWEDHLIEDTYDSVFYDNVGYGKSSASQGSITGDPLFFDRTDKIYLTAANNVLRFTIDGAADYKEITLPTDEAGCTISEIVEEINDQLGKKGAIASPFGNSLVIKSLSTGSKSTLEFDRKAGSVFEATYNTLFCNTRYFPPMETGANQTAYITGNAAFSGKIELDASNDSLLFNVTVDGSPAQSCKIDGISGTYENLDDLLTKLNNNIIPSDIKNKIIFSKASGGKITIEPNKNSVNDIKRIDFDGSGQKNSTYKTLFVGTKEEVISPSIPIPQKGTAHKVQGGTDITTTPINGGVVITGPKQPIDVDDKHCTLSFNIFGYPHTVSVPIGTYNGMEELFHALKNAIANSSDPVVKRINATYDSSSKKLEFGINPTWEDPYSSYDRPNDLKTYTMSISSSSTIWGSILGTKPKDNDDPVANEKKSLPFTLTSYAKIPEPVTIDDKNNKLKLNQKEITLTNKTYTLDELKNELQAKLGSDITVVVDDGKLQFQAKSSISGSGSFYSKVLSKEVPSDPKRDPENGKYDGFTRAFVVGRKDMTEAPIDIVEGANNTLAFDFTYVPTFDSENRKDVEIEIKIPEGDYSGPGRSAYFNEIGDKIEEKIKEEVQKKYGENAFTDFEVSVDIVKKEDIKDIVGAADEALRITVKAKSNTEPPAGKYILDGIRGSAAGFLFYKMTAEPTPTYITGTKKLREPIQFSSANNVLTMTIDDKQPYKYTFPTDRQYTADEFINLLNDMFKNGDDNGKTSPIRASIENGYLKLSHQVPGNHTITDIGGSARSYLFLEEKGRDSNSRDPLRLQVSGEAKDKVDVPRMRIGSTALAIHSLFISKPKNAQKALRRIGEAITMMGAKRGTYGAIQNRLEHLVANNNNMVENTQASESAIRDADMAREAVQNSLHNIMMQTSQAMLSQANQMPDMVQKLLQA